MRSTIIFFFFLTSTLPSFSQSIEKRVSNAMNRFTQHEQVKHAIASFTMADENGKIIYHYNDQFGLAPASNMKVFTSIAALDILGKDYQYKTEIGYSGNIKDSILIGTLFIKGNGDPTTGSWRYTQTQSDTIMKQLCTLLRKKGIREIRGSVFLDGSSFSVNAVPSGWSWGDIGNYYGAGTWGLNWHENQYDMKLKPGKDIGDNVDIKEEDPEMPYTTFINKLTTAEKSSGDNSLIYLTPNSDVAIIEGTIPNGNLFTVSGSLPEPYTAWISAIKKGFIANRIIYNGTSQTSMDMALQNKAIPHYDSLIDYLYSPTLDSMNYFFLKKSINLYGEDFIKTIASQKKNDASTDDGVDAMKKFWIEKGIEKSAFNIKDGCGLSAETRVTTDALVKALLYAKGRDWFPVFYDA